VVDLKFGNMSKLYNSEFYDSVVIAIVDNADYQYQTLVPLFNEYGYGFVAPNQKLVFIDGGRELSKNTLKWIEAHEVAHIILGHKKEKDSNDEIEADTLAYKLLIGNGYHKAAQLVKNKFVERHGIKFK
jgi:Zn-dependent peptidase ImmA (M78 family)